MPRTALRTEPCCRVCRRPIARCTETDSHARHGGTPYRGTLLRGQWVDIDTTASASGYSQGGLSFIPPSQAQAASRNGSAAG